LADAGAWLGEGLEPRRLLVFEDEGHDVLKLPKRVRCYETIVDFFREQLSP
jgi:dipeptidyl aminopeptidase/acylaminoacyl peptidase